MSCLLSLTPQHNRVRTGKKTHSERDEQGSAQEQPWNHRVNLLRHSTTAYIFHPTSESDVSGVLSKTERKQFGCSDVDPFLLQSSATATRATWTVFFFGDSHH